MKRVFLIGVLIYAVSGVFSQKDPEAKKILDRLSAQSLSDYPIQVSFEYFYEDLMDKQTTTESGQLLISQKKFRLSIGESVIYCDGITVWNHLKSANEVYISDAEEGNSDNDFFISNPSDLFTFYQEGFKYRMTGEINYNGESFLEIDIFPEDLDKNYHTVKLLINKKTNQLYSAEAFGKQGANHTVILKDYKPKVRLDEESFVFEPEKFPGVEMVDTRF